MYDRGGVRVGREHRVEHVLDRAIVNDQREPFTPRQWLRHPWPMVGEPEELAERIREYGRARCDHMMIWFDPVTPEAVDALAPVLALLDS